jgi:hypothetical protein
MTDLQISIAAGQSKRLLTGGKYCPENIVVSAEKFAPIEEKDVNFWDYDGTLLYSYTLEEVQAMTQLPPLPTQPRLICQGWNWTLERLKEQGYADVGAVYITDDGKTRLIVEIADLLVPMIYLNWRGGTVNIDWGDGSDVETNVAAGNHQHEYANIGEYEITLEVVSGELIPGNNNGPLVGSAKTAERGKLKRIYFGNGTTTRFSGYGFSNSVYLEVVTLPEGITHIGASELLACKTLGFFVFPKSVTTTEAVFNQCTSLFGVSLPEKITTLGRLFKYCHSLRRMNIPDTVTAIANEFANESSIEAINFPNGLRVIPSQCFQGCQLLRKAELSDSTTDISSNAFYNCPSLVTLEIPSGVKTISSNAFYNCVSLVQLRFLPETPPTVSNANAFTGIPTDCVVEVPAESLELYQNATNYAGIAA